MNAPHQFHIPVMGLAYTIDSPIKVARFGISSVISIVEDRLIELMRRHYYAQTNQPYVPINQGEKDYRARRITDYLNLVQRIVRQQTERLRNEAFEKGSELSRYFEMLPTQSPLRKAYVAMLAEKDPLEKERQQAGLRSRVVAGSIDVNIMTKVDKNNYGADGDILENGSDALAALRGYSNSELTNSSVVFSAGLNPRLFNYLESFRGLDATAWGRFEKKVVIKVSDYRSALIQGKYLAKKGIWVSEFRIESGLNCGGHAFATDGYLLGPILQEFADKRSELSEALFVLYDAALRAKGGLQFGKPHPIRYTVQGGIGTAAEARFLLEEYGMESTGWGSPLLLCPEATTVDAGTLAQLCSAGEKDVVLSHNSPLGVRFHYLKGTTSEKEKKARIATGRPGSPCTEKHLVSNTEFTEAPLCSASLKYQQLKLKQIDTLPLAPEEKEKQQQLVLDKECLCVGLINAAVKAYQLPALKKQEGVTVCPGPNIAYFNRQVSLAEMTDHIYGRANVLAGVIRPHMFLKELELYLLFLGELVAAGAGAKQINAFAKNLQEGIAYYENLLPKLFTDPDEQSSFAQALRTSTNEIRVLTLPAESLLPAC